VTVSSYGWFPPSRPIEVEGGVKARSRRGAIGQKWWSARFVKVLENLGMGGRLARGKNYARRGQVLDLWVEPGMVGADVQGSRRRPYRVRILLSAWGKADWAKAVDALVGDAWYTAKLLAGEMPAEIVDLFASLGLNLFPANSRELVMDCSCPDWEVPCKHLAAVFYLLAERFDDDPFEVLAWRGRNREELLALLSARRVGVVPADRAETGDATWALADSLDSFWVIGGGVAQAAGAAPVSARPAPLLARDTVLAQVPPPGLKVRGVDMADALRPAYLASGPAA
jgi:uncharacterized Zn finger protein